MKKFKDLLTYLGIGAGAIAGTGLGFGGAKLAIDLIESNVASKGKGLPLLKAGVHLKEGNHRIVIDDQFYEMLTYETTKEDQDLAINGIAKAYENLNQLNRGIKFELCTTVPELTNYGLTKVDKVGKSDIPLFVTTENLDGSKNVLAHTNWTYNFFNGELKDQSITFRKDALLTVYTTYDAIEETLAPLNTLAYTVTAHESMHLMGFSHIDDKESIMNTYVSLFSPRDFTEYDKQIIDKYNVEFYHTEPIYSNTTTSEKIEDDLAF